MGQLGAVACYTLDSGDADMIDDETFSADLATVTIHGINIHPSIAKDRMVNAVRIAAAFVESLPKDSLSPETTDGRDGFVHPYILNAGCELATIQILLRDFETAKLTEQADMLKSVAARTETQFPARRSTYKLPSNIEIWRKA